MMTVTQLAQRLARKVFGLDFARLPMTSAEELRDGMNAGLDEFVRSLPEHRRHREETRVVDEPRSVFLTVSAGEKAITITTGFPVGFHASAAALAGKGLVFTSGSPILRNRVISESVMLLPWLGSSGSASAVIYDDGHVFQGRLDQLAGGVTWQNGSQRLPLKMENKANETDASPGIPERWWLESLGGSEAGQNLVLMRLHPAPSVAGVLSMMVAQFPAGISLAELHTSGRSLPCDDIEAAHLVNLCAVHLIGSEGLREGFDGNAVADAAENSRRALAGRKNPNPSGEHNSVGTPFGF